VSVFVKNEWLKPDNKEEIARLQAWEASLQADIADLNDIIEHNSRYWNNTNVQQERDTRHAFNEELRKQMAYNKGKLKVVQACFKNLS
jgi:ATP/maltotriose-dependent transcriptional regulator MalT